MKLTSKGFQHGTEIDAQTHQKTMPKLVTEMIRKIIKNHVSQKSKINQIHNQNKGF